MVLKRLALLLPLLAASSVAVTSACNQPLESCGPDVQSCLASGCADTLGRIGQYQIYWGDLHGHTENSDGKGSLDHYFSYARDTAKLDFVVVTDHDYGKPEAPWKLPRETWTLTTEKADEYTVNGRFVGIAGYEWTTNPNFWTSATPLFAGPPKYYDHKNVYFPGRVDYIFGAMEPEYESPDLLAQAVRKVGGLIHNNHLDPLQWPDEFAYTPGNASVIVNSEMWADTVQVAARRFTPNTELTLRRFLGTGGMTGFVGGSDTHDGTPTVKTAVLARSLTRPAIFEALRHRRNYAVSHAPIVLDVRIAGHYMGEAITIKGAPRIAVDVRGTATIEEVIIVRDGAVIHSIHPGTQSVKFDYVDKAFGARSYYYVRVIQADRDEYGNRSRAWSSPIWVTEKE
jgi:hypothetical protein